MSRLIPNDFTNDQPSYQHATEIQRIESMLKREEGGIAFPDAVMQSIHQIGLAVDRIMLRQELMMRRIEQLEKEDDQDPISK